MSSSSQNSRLPSLPVLDSVAQRRRARVVAGCRPALGSPTAADDDAGGTGPRLGRVGCDRDHGRRVRRPPEFRDGDHRPGAGGGRFSRRHHQPARLAIGRCVSSARATSAVVRRQCGQHGFDDQPLHGQSQGAQRRRLFARRPHRFATRSGDPGLLPAGARRFAACR